MTSTEALPDDTSIVVTDPTVPTYGLTALGVLLYNLITTENDGLPLAEWPWTWGETKKTPAEQQDVLEQHRADAERIWTLVRGRQAQLDAHRPGDAPIRFDALTVTAPDPDKPLIEPAAAAPVAAPIVTVADLTPAVPAPSTEADTHVLVPIAHVSFLHQLVDDVERGLAGAEHALVAAFRRVFT